MKVTSPNGIEVLVDPWQNDASGFWGLWYYKLYPMTRTDIMISTHNHFDHNAFDRVESPMNLDRMVGRFFLGDVEIEGIADKHAIGKYEDGLFNELRLEKNPPNNVALLDNVIFLVAPPAPNPSTPLLRRLAGRSPINVEVKIERAHRRLCLPTLLRAILTSSPNAQ